MTDHIDVAARSASYRQYALHTVFQPIFSLSHRRTVGFEALLRASDGDTPSTPLTQLIETANAHNELRQLDTLCQSLHSHNFANQGAASRWLFLNVEPATVTRRSYEDGTFLRVLDAAGVPPHQVVIEILEGRITDEPALLDAITFFREAGALVALDDFGAGHANFDRIWRLSPDIIKLDRGLILEAEQHSRGRLRRVLPNLVSLIHEAGSLVLSEGIETEAQALVAMESDVDFVQGFYFSRPNTHIDIEAHDATRRLVHLTAEHVSASTAQESVELQRLAPYIDAFRRTLTRLTDAAPLPRAANELLALGRTARVYILDSKGGEVSRANGRHQAFSSPSTVPLEISSGGNWYRRQYFKAAVNDPGRLQISRPYLSSTGAHMCITLSMAPLETPGWIICCDVTT